MHLLPFTSFGEWWEKLADGDVVALGHLSRLSCFTYRAIYEHQYARLLVPSFKIDRARILVPMAQGKHLFPFRTQQLSSVASMVLRGFTWESRYMPRFWGEIFCFEIFENRRISSSASNFSWSFTYYVNSLRKILASLNFSILRNSQQLLWLIHTVSLHVS